MPKPGSIIEFYDVQNQFKVAFMMYADLKVILEPIQGSSSDPKGPYTKEVNQLIPFGWCVYSKFAYEKVENPLRLLEARIALKSFATTSKKKLRGLYHVS